MLAEATALLKDLLRADTSNPPGNERRAAEPLAAFLRAGGVEHRLLGPDPARPNLVARVRGSGGGPTLAFVGHLDVVPANPDLWTKPPFAAIEEDGWIWGRGAVDMKCGIAAWATALAELARGDRLRGDLVLVCAADEEQGKAEVGMPWLAENAADEIRCDFAIGEGCGERFDIGGRRVYLYGVGEKAGVLATVKLPGRPGDISLPTNGNNPLPDLARALDAVADYRARPTPPSVLEPLLARVAAAETVEPALERLLDALVRNVFVATSVSSTRVNNIVPDRAELELRAHLVPGVGRDDLVRELREIVGERDVEVGDPHGGTQSPADSRLADALRTAMASEDPDAELMPTLGPGYTDLAPLRERFGTVAYGFIPFRTAPALLNQETKHGSDERIHVDDLALQARVGLAVAREVCG